MPTREASRTRDRGRDDRDDDRDRGRDRDDDRAEPRGGRAKGGSSGFAYRGRTSEENSRRAKQSSGRYDSFINDEVLWFSPREGENCIRIIPWASADPIFDPLVEKWGTHWGIDLITHMGVGADKGTYLCCDKMKGEPCPICEVWREETIDALKPKDRVLTWLIDRDDEKSGPKLWAMPMSNSKDIAQESQVKGSGELLAIDDPEEGYDVFFTREGTKRNTRYKQFSVDRDPSPLSKDAKKQDKWLAYVTETPLPDLLKFYDPDHLEKVLSGQVSAREDAEDDGEERGRRSRRGGDDDRPARRGRDRDDDPPPRSSRRARDPDPDPEEDADAPRSRSRRGGDDDRDAEFTRPSRRPARDDRGPEEAADPEPEDRPARGSRRASRDPEPEPEDPPPRGRRASAREPVDDDLPPRTERYRGRDKDADPEADPEPDDTRERLGRVGRRSGR